MTTKDEALAILDRVHWLRQDDLAALRRYIESTAQVPEGWTVEKAFGGFRVSVWLDDKHYKSTLAAHDSIISEFLSALLASSPPAMSQERSNG